MARNNILAPIVLFVYNRPEHTTQTLNALADNPLASESILYIYCDGPKHGIDRDAYDKILAVRKIVNNEQRFDKVIVIENELNKGLAKSIIAGVTEIVNQFGKVIVLEDDIVASRGFLKYMNEALTMYQDDARVGCIHGWNFNLDTSNYLHSTFFLRGADCWGWATWDRAWEKFNPSGQMLLSIVESRKEEYQFNRRGTENFLDMLKSQIHGLNDSWAVRWHASLFVEGMYCLQPARTITKNIGLDNSGVHCGPEDIEQVSVDEIELCRIDTVDSEWFFEAREKYLQKEIHRYSKWQKLKRFLKRLFLQ